MDKQRYPELKNLTALTAVLTICLAVVYFPVLFAGREFYYKDTCEFFEPLCRFIGNSLSHGHLPIWNPYAYCGMSQAAISSPSIFFPLNWLFTSSETPRFSSSLGTILLICQLIAAVGTYLLIDSFEWGTLPAVIAATAMGLCGYMFSLSSNYTLVATAAFVPLAIHSTRRCLSGSKPWLLANVLIVYLLITAGRPEIWVPAMALCLGVCAIAYLPTANEQPFKLRGLGAVLLSIVLGVLLAMPVILPALEWIPRSERGSLAPSEVLMFSANWYDMLNIFVPEPFGNLQRGPVPFANLVVPSSTVPYGGSPFVGSIIFALALMGIFKGGGRNYWAAMALLIASGVFSLGENIQGMSWLISHVPGLSLLRFPRKLLFFTDFALTLFAARGAYLYSSKKLHLQWHVITWLIVAAAGNAIANSPTVLLPFCDTGEIQQAIEGQHIIGADWFAQAVIALATVGLMWLMQRKDKAAPALKLAAAGAGALLVFNAASNCIATAPSMFYSDSSYLVDSLGLNQHRNEPKPRIAPLYPPSFIVPDAVFNHIDRKDPAAVAVWNFRYNRDMMRGFSNIDFEIPSPLGFEGAKPAAYCQFYTLVYSRSAQSHSGVSNPTDLPLYRWLQITSCKYVCTQMYDHFADGKMESAPRLDDNYFDLVFSNASSNMRAYLIKDALPRAYLAATWRNFASPSELLSHMINSDRTGFDPAKETLVDRQIGAPPPVAAITPVTIDESEPELLQMHVKTDQQRLLVLQDQYYPGWHVEVDGAPAQLLRCNAFMRGVMLAPGEHNVRFYFRPLTLTLGFALSTIAAMVVLLIAFWPLLSRKRHR